MRYLALFRGINVGGRNIVKMKELKELFLELGFSDVRSYIQSGNLLFSSDQAISEFSETVTAAFTERFGFSVPIIYRTKDELFSLIENLPFTAEEILEAEMEETNVEHLYVYFSSSEMVPQELSEIGERAIVKSKDIYYLTDRSIRFSKLTPKLNKLTDELTARNWKTVIKLAVLLKE